MLGAAGSPLKPRPLRGLSADLPDEPLAFLKELAEHYTKLCFFAHSYSYVRDRAPDASAGAPPGADARKGRWERLRIAPSMARYLLH